MRLTLPPESAEVQAAAAAAVGQEPVTTACERTDFSSVDKPGSVQRTGFSRSHDLLEVATDVSTEEPTTPGEESPVSPRSSSAEYLESAFFKNPSLPTLFIFDWDDTLLPSTWLYQQNQKLDASCVLSEEMKSDLNAMADACRLTLEMACAWGEVVIVTNARPNWVEMSCAKFMPNLLPLVSQLRIVSARARWEPLGYSNPADWKLRTFETVIDEFISVVRRDREREKEREKEYARSPLPTLGGVALLSQPQPQQQQQQQQASSVSQQSAQTEKETVKEDGEQVKKDGKAKEGGKDEDNTSEEESDVASSPSPSPVCPSEGPTDSDSPASSSTAAQQPDSASTSAPSSSSSSCSPVSSPSATDSEDICVASFGDSYHERNAVFAVAKQEEAWGNSRLVAKSLKFVEMPSLRDLLKEHFLLADVFPNVARHNAGLDLCVHTGAPKGAPSPESSSSSSSGGSEGAPPAPPTPPPAPSPSSGEAFG
uniref:Uncharacterized protein n=1 Tax=Chromera velia CCMP2878 TaxID=1169474 RepID=A0A0G4HMD9_9ALVE|eukprot:Cvel_29220.t1-p1 / transcript=Cvel_29220.t1 / gene=Cvel_29220 / organism=Chromera_velia_CCMP2878 / gene_product=hypothetical protein / transcript_product=hypothetical protein / location=Cvel_scaffold3960:5679-8863(-) / protein_length=482 / sequence_SO=supercontig / SO=protein_coding / is_pseudo=false